MLVLLSTFQDDILDKLSQAIHQAGGYKNAEGVWYHLGLALRSAGLYEEARSTFERVIESNPNSPVAIQSAFHLARIAILTRNFARAEEILNWIKERVGTDKDVLRWANVWAGLKVQTDKIKTGWEHLAQIVHRFKDTTTPKRHPGTWTYVLVSYAGASILLDRFQEAESALQQAAKILASLAPEGDRFRDRGFVVVSINLGELYRLKGEVEKSREILQKALDLAQKHGFQDFLADARMNLAHTLAEAGKDLDLAEELLIEAEAFYRRQEHHADLVETRWIRAKILWQRGKKKEALKLAQEALQKAVEYALRAKEAAIAETLYHWTGKVSFKLQAAEAYQKIGNEARAQALKGD